MYFKNLILFQIEPYLNFLDQPGPNEVGLEVHPKGTEMKAFVVAATALLTVHAVFAEPLPSTSDLAYSTSPRKPEPRKDRL